MKTPEEKKKHTEYMKEYYVNNPEKYKKALERNKINAEKNKEKKKDYDKKRREELGQVHVEKAKEYYVNNKEKVREYKKNWTAKKRKENISYRIKCSISGSIRSSLGREKRRKSLITEQIIGCSFDNLKLHLENQFQDWMSWDNYGKYNGELNYGWDIDHIIPLDSADTIDELISLNHFSNLQPLCSKVNRDIKRNKINWSSNTTTPIN